MPDLSSMLPSSSPELNSGRDPRLPCKATRLYSASSYNAPMSPKLLPREVRICRGNKPFRGQCRTLWMGGASIAMIGDTSLVLVPSRSIAPTRHLPPTQSPTKTTARQNFVCGSVNHVTVDEAQEAPDVVLGMFSVNSTIAIILFDSGALHSFISASYEEKHNIPVAMLKCRMVVSFCGGDMPVRQVCPKAKIILKGVEFSANLIVLDTKGIDVIMGIYWMSKQKALIDYARKSVKLTTEDEQEGEYVAEPLITHKGATNQIKLNQLEAEQSRDVHVVNEYPDVFF
jgi:hypothetical protein